MLSVETTSFNVCILKTNVERSETTVLLGSSSLSSRSDQIIINECAWNVRKKERERNSTKTSDDRPKKRGKRKLRRAGDERRIEGSTTGSLWLIFCSDKLRCAYSHTRDSNRAVVGDARRVSVSGGRCNFCFSLIFSHGCQTYRILLILQHFDLSKTDKELKISRQR